MTSMEYAENLQFCSERGLTCFEYHRRHRKKEAI